MFTYILTAVFLKTILFRIEPIQFINNKGCCMLKKNNILIAVIVLVGFMANNLFAQDEIISSGSLSITVTKVTKGIKISSIKKDDTELLDTKAISPFFSIVVSGKFLSAFGGWDSVAILNTGSEATITLTNPTDTSLPTDLTATITVTTSGKKSDWDLSITGLGNKSLTEIFFPYLNIKAAGNDNFLTPSHSGRVIKNPKSQNINETLKYPRWAAAMQFCAYYNDNYGIYLGTHDPKASIKKFIIKANIHDGIKFQNEIIVPDKGKPGNDWEYSGVFRFEVFDGDWYDAAIIYRKWASEEADYWPKDTPEKLARREAMGKIAVWMRFYDDKNSISSIKSWITNFSNFMGVPMGLHWYMWNNKANDDDYPYFFPAKPGMKEMVHELQQGGNITIMPYINALLYDKGLPNYNDEGKVWSVKKESGGIQSQSYYGRSFAVQCPTQEGYQDIIADACKQLTDAEQIGCGGVYLDQVAYANGYQCYDTTHMHPIGGGDAWRSGYNEMFEKIENVTESGKFLTSEGNCDFIADEVDGFLAQQWLSTGLVPAFQAVYSGKVQVWGTKAGHNNDSRFYCQSANSFVNGVVPGRFYVSTIDKPQTGPYNRKIARLRYKLREYLSFGRMLKPIPIDRTGIENITSKWGNIRNVTISALQSSLWKNRDNNKALILLANASMTKTLNFILDFDGSSRGLFGNLKVQKITEDTDGEIVSKDNSFNMGITLQPKDVIAYIIEPDSIGTGLKEENIKSDYKLEQNYPNPFNPSTTISFSIPRAGRTKLSVFNILGEEIAVLLNKELLSGNYEVNFDGVNLSSGIYFYKLQSNNFTSIKKMMLIK